MSDTKEDIKGALRFAAHVAISLGVTIEDLFELLQKEYEAVKQIGVKKDASKGVRLESVGIGHFVTYVDPKKGPLMAHVLEVKEKGKLKIRVHMGTANADMDLDDVPYSAKPKKEHWNHR